MNTSELQQAVKMEYYTPEENELFIGYQCQIRMGNADWADVEITNEKGDFLTFQQWLSNLKNNNIRTKCLCKTDIINNDWRYIDYSKEGIDGIFELNINEEEQYKLYFFPNNKINIFKNGHTIYFGNIKSVNELKKICKWLNIK